MSAFAPKAHLTAPIWNWGPYYVGVVNQIKNGTWKSSAVWPGMDQGIVDLAPFSDMVPAKVQKKVLAMKADLTSGKAKVFKGPIRDQAGNVKIAANSVAEDKVLLGMTWFVKGVIGTTE